MLMHVKKALNMMKMKKMMRKMSSMRGLTGMLQQRQQRMLAVPGSCQRGVLRSSLGCL
jgi:hypothetical protein